MLHGEIDSDCLFSLAISIPWNRFFCMFFGHSFAYVAHFVLVERVWIRTQRSAVASRRATNLATHLPNLATHLLNLATHLPNLATHLPNLATHLPNLAIHLPNLATHLVSIKAYKFGLRLLELDIFCRRRERFIFSLEYLFQEVKPSDKSR
jgi:hypothetical protein